MAKEKTGEETKGPANRNGNVPGKSSVSERKNYLITIGIDKYENENIPRLDPCCARDCDELEKVLHEQYDFTVLHSLRNDEAKKEDITKVFEDLRDYPQFKRTDKEPAHNLIIYYSGHGVLAPVNQVDMFFWVPYDYPEDKTLEAPDTRYLYGFNRDLINSIGEIRYHHLLFIVDSCHSGQAISFSSFHPDSAEVTTSNAADQPSCCALCSCAANQKSYITKNQHSFFTWHLLQMLENNAEPAVASELLFTQLRFSKAFQGKGQELFHRRLGLLPDNNGALYFTATQEKKDQVVVKRVRSTLSKGIPKFLNFTEEKRKLLTPGQRHFFNVIKGDKGSALKVLASSLQNQGNFPGFKKNVPVIEEGTLPPTDDASEKLLHLFSRININCQSEKELITKLSATLNIQNVVLLLFFQKNTPENGELVNNVIQLLEKVQALGATKRHFYFYAFDECNSDHKLRTAINDAFEINLVTAGRYITQQDIDEWYGNQLFLVTGSADEEIISEYITNNIYMNLNNGYQDERPAVAIKNICERARCPELADILLSSTEPINYVL